jgi:steroid 5-alpha reductase family enzyme
LLFAAGLALTYWKSDFVARHYTPIINFFSVVGVLGAALLPIAVHLHRSSADVYWSVNSSLTSVVIVTYGFNRLTARNTAAIVVPTWRARRTLSLQTSRCWNRRCHAYSTTLSDLPMPAVFA